MSAVTFECVALDCPDPHGLARFYAEVLGWQVGEDGDDEDWVTLRNPDGGTKICFQRDPHFQPPTWPSRERQQMEHLDFRVADLPAAHRSVLAAGAVLLDDSQESFWVYADPAGHPFCLCR